LYGFPLHGVLHKTGFNGWNGIRILAVMALGTLFFLPAAWTRKYGSVPFRIIYSGHRIVIITDCINPYITILGPIGKRQAKE